MKNKGKIFEDNFKNSCYDELLVYRPPDAAQGFDVGASSKLRFSQHSPCDFFIFDGEKMFTLELKSVDKCSVSFENVEGDNGVIHYYQIESLKTFAKHKNVISGLVLDFRGSDNTYFLNINDWELLVKSVYKKSFNERDLLQFTDPIKIEKRKLKVNYRYNIQKLINDCKEIY